LETAGHNAADSAIPEIGPIPKEENLSMKVRTYLNYGGNCAEAFRFYEEHLGAKFGMIMTYDQMPGQSDIATQMKGKVLHASIALGDTELMASDVPPDRFQPMRSVYVCLSVESDTEAEHIYKILTDWRGSLHAYAGNLLRHKVRPISR